MHMDSPISITTGVWGLFPIIIIFMNVLILFLGLYIAYLFMKALKIYIRNNENINNEKTNNKD